MRIALSKETIRGFLSVVVGVLVAMTIIFIAQLLSPKIFAGLEVNNPARYYILTQQVLPSQIRNEIIGLILSFFMGPLLSSLISRKKNMVHALLVPVIVLSVIGLTEWDFKLQKELIFLVLPIWMLFALAGFYVSELIKRRRKKAA